MKVFHNLVSVAFLACTRIHKNNISHHLSSLDDSFLSWNKKGQETQDDAPIGIFSSSCSCSCSSSSSSSTAVSPEETTKTHTSSHRRRGDDHVVFHNKHLKWIFQKDAIVLIDVENVRGKTFFQSSHRKLLQRTTAWTQIHNLEGRVAFVMDHGSKPSGYFLKEGGIAVIFSGPNMKADDVLARDVAFFQKNVVVVTSDGNLMARCRGTMNRVLAQSTKSVHFLNPLEFLKDLDKINERMKREKMWLDQYPNKNRSLLSKEDELWIPHGEKKDSTAMPKKRQSKKYHLILYHHLCSKEDNIVTRNVLETRMDILDKLLQYDQQFEHTDVLQWEEERYNRKRFHERTMDRIFLSERFRWQVQKISMVLPNDDQILNHEETRSAFDRYPPALGYVLFIQQEFMP